jgi:hypothetical protein
MSWWRVRVQYDGHPQENLFDLSEAPTDDDIQVILRRANGDRAVIEQDGVRLGLVRPE